MPACDTVRTPHIPGHSPDPQSVTHLHLDSEPSATIPCMPQLIPKLLLNVGSPQRRSNILGQAWKGSDGEREHQERVVASY